MDSAICQLRSLLAVNRGKFLPVREDVPPPRRCTPPPEHHGFKNSFQICILGRLWEVMLVRDSNRGVFPVYLTELFAYSMMLLITPLPAEPVKRKITGILHGALGSVEIHLGVEDPRKTSASPC
ncbi:hypothetical protein NQZ79_g4700 [Umbelopsis isabellina]|nr:hypothetical protein NQZ79_g4700 [Umbelopsis isabellina]